MDGHQELRDSEQLFRGAMRAASIGMCLVAPDGSFLEVNPALCDLLGREESVLVHTTWQELTHPDDVAVDAALVQAVLDGERDSYQLLKRYLRPDGEIVWGDLSVSCVRDPDGTVLYFVSQINDVTRRIVAEQKLGEAEALYRLVAENAGNFVLLIEDGQRISWVSPSAVRLSGYDSEEDLIARGLSHVHPDDAWKLAAAADAVRSGTEVVTQEMRLRDRHGAYSWWSVTTRWAQDANHDQLVLSFLDIDSEVRARAALKESEERYRWLVDNMQDTLVASDTGGRITFASPSITGLLGWRPREIVGVRLLEITHHDDREVALKYAEVLPQADVPPLTVRIVRNDGEFAWVEIHGRLVTDPAGSVVGSISVWHDASHSVRQERELRHLAESDPLTGLPNRRELQARLGEMLRQRRRDEQTAILFCDIDNFKDINDRFGHGAGDHLLQIVAHRIEDAVRAEDLVARFGGDELVIGLGGISDLESAVHAAHKILAHVSQAVPLPNGPTVTPTMSIGVALARTGEDAVSILERADVAMYRAKSRGGDQVYSSQ